MRIVASDQGAVALAAELTEWSLLSGLPAGLDTETVGCDPAKESPVERARVWCMTVAWGEPDQPPSPYETAFIPAAYLYHFKPWLEDHTAKKTGTNLFGFDRHVFHNEGIELRGIVGDTLRMSRILDPAKKPAHAEGHGLKRLGLVLGYEVEAFDSFSTRPKPGAIRSYKKDRTVTKDGVTYHYTAGAEVQNVSFKSTEYIPLDVLWRDYPQRRQRVVEYACKDPAMNLDAYWWLRKRLEGVRW